MIQAEFSNSFQARHPAIAALRLGAAVHFGGMIGIDREVNAEGAGLRTHILVSLAACLFSLFAFKMWAGPTGKGSDSLRLIQAATSSVMFLAAGSIITLGGKLRDHTAGAGMWMAGAARLTCDVGNIALGDMASVTAVIGL